MSGISTLGAELASIGRLSKGQSSLNTLTQQLSSGIKSSNLDDYSATEAKKLINLNSSLASQKNYVDVCSQVSTRITSYDSALSGIEKIISNASTLATSSSSYDASTNASTASEIKGFLQQVSYYLNLQVGSRYIFAGSRYQTAPVSDLSSLPTLTTASTETVVTTPTLPTYDIDYTGAGSTNAAAYAVDSVSVDPTESLQYGISSDDASFQEVALGLRYAYAATQDPTNYATLMTSARTYLSQGLSDVQAVHSTLSSNGSTLTNVKTKLSNDINDIESQLSNIQSVDTNEVSVRITSLQTQIEASYSATAELLKLSLLKYL